MKTRYKSYYVCKGSVRGECGHAHRELIAAIRCLRRDQRACKMQGGYSDRHIYSVANGHETPVEWDESWENIK